MKHETMILLLLFSCHRPIHFYQRFFWLHNRKSFKIIFYFYKYFT